MHYYAMIVTKNKPSENDIDKIMEPYNEHDFYERNGGDDADISTEAFPEFMWDYYTILEIRPFDVRTLPNYHAAIDVNGVPASRKHWDGMAHKSQLERYFNHVRDICRDPDSKWMTIVDYHN